MISKKTLKYILLYYIKDIFDKKMESIKKVIYLGIGCRIDPVLHLSNVNEFVFIDTNPRSECDSKEFYKGFYKKKFYDELIQKYTILGFDLQLIKELDNNYHKKIFNIKQKLFYFICFKQKPKFINPTLLVFTNNETKQIIKYYISTNILYNMNDLLLNDIKEADALIMCGHNPHTKLLNYFDKPKIFLGYSNTNYTIELHNTNEDRANIVYFLHNTDNVTLKFFNRYFLIKCDTGEEMECKNIIDLEYLKQRYNNKL